MLDIPRNTYTMTHSITIQDKIIDEIIFSLKNFALRDIKVISDQDTVLATFILCSCFIEQLSGFRYGKTNHKTHKKMFEDFVNEYLPQYDPKKLREDLRNKLVHNYSLGLSYSLVQRHSELHLKPTNQNGHYLNLENFIGDIDAAFDKFSQDLTNKSEAKANALKWYDTYQIIGLSRQNLP